MAMAAVIESHQWQLNPLAFVLLFASCFASLFFFPNKTPSSSSSSTPSSSSSNPFDAGPTTFNRCFLLLYSLASVMEGLHSVFGEDAFANYGIGREERAFYLAGGAAAALFLGSLLGIFSDITCRSMKGLSALLHLSSSRGHHEMPEQPSKHMDNESLCGTCVFCILLLLRDMDGY